MHRLIIVAGPSGSGKSRLVAAIGCPRLNLDDFYREGDEPGLPRALGIVDWDDPATWDADAALAAIHALCTSGRAEVPIYDIAQSRRVGRHRVELGDARVFVAEGIFAPDIVPTVRASGLAMDALYLDRPRLQNLVLRFLRDVREHRKPIGVLVRRGLALWRDEPRLRAYAVAQGCQPVSFTEALAIARTEEKR